MTEYYYVSGLNITFAISEILVEGYHITIDDRRFERVSRKPRGRKVSRVLLNESTNERFLIYP